MNSGRCICHSTLHHGDACDLRHCPSHGGLECAEHGECNHHTGECRCSPSWTGRACEQVGGQPQAPELSDLSTGDHYPTGLSPTNVYYPRGICAGLHCTRTFPGLRHWADGLTSDGEDGRVPGGRQRAGSQSGEQDKRVERRFSLQDDLRDGHLKLAMDNEKCFNCGNIPHQGYPGWVPPLDGTVGASGYVPVGQSGSVDQGTVGLNSAGYHVPYRAHGTVHNP